MSKKHKKFDRNAILNQLNKKQEAPKTNPENIVKKTATESKADYVDAKIAKQDLKKTAIIIGCLAIVLLIIYYLSLKTNIIADFSNTLASWLHIE